MRDRRVLLVGNPNVGKSTVFNALTGLHQHTGNWPGKTVTLARGKYRYKGNTYMLEDLPGAYSLDTRSREEQVTREALLAGDWDCVVVVCDGTNLRRSLILVLQVLELCNNAVVLVNLLDEADRRGLSVDCKTLERELGVPVVAGAAGRNRGLDDLQEQIRMVSDGFGTKVKMKSCSRRERIRQAEALAERAVLGADRGMSWQLMWDKLLTGRRTGVPIMVLGLFFILWLTIAGANVPTGLLWQGVLWLYERLEVLFSFLHAPRWLAGALLDGVVLTAGRVISVMLPPMAVFFPLFTLLEDLGYLPRVAYTLDNAFEKSGGCGKMGLTMCMGLGCNAVGVMGARIIESPRERMLAVVTNSFVPCNGRFGGLILLLGFLMPTGDSGMAALGLTGLLVMSFFVTMAVSKILSGTVLEGLDSGFILELPPFRRPQVGQVLFRSLLDRTLFVLGRAVWMAVPAGLIIWCLGQISLMGEPFLWVLARWLGPVGNLLGFGGVVLLAFLLGTPANELVLPMVVLILSGGYQMEVEAGELLAGLTLAGFGTKEALCTLLFFLFHWPCATTIMTIYRETGSKKWTALAALVPTVAGAGLCILVQVIFG